MKKHNILSKLKRISRKIACIIATAVMCLNNIGLNQIKQVSAQTSMGNDYKITENDSTKNKWQNTDKNGDQMTHRFSSYESDKSKALKVDASYGFKLQKTSATKVTVTKGTKCAAPSKFNGEDLELLAFMKKYTWFKTSKNTANNIQIKISDLTVYQCNSDGSNGHWVKVDLVRTITAIEKYKNQDGYIALGLGITDAVYIGIEEMTVNNVFYKAGTSQKVTLKSNVTLTDIDTRQYIGVSASKIDGQYVSNNTTLSYLKNGNKNFYYADNDINYSGEAKTAVGFIFEDNSFVYTFGRIKPEEPTNQEQYVGTGQSMTEFEPSSPVKTVTDQDEKDVKENTVEHLGGNQDAGLGSDPEAGKTPSAQNKGRTGHYGAEFYGESGRPAETVPLALHPERPRRNGFRNRRPRYHIHLSAFHLRRCQIPQKNIMEHDGHRLRNRRAGYGGA